MFWHVPSGNIHCVLSFSGLSIRQDDHPFLYPNREYMSTRPHWPVHVHLAWVFIECIPFVIRNTKRFIHAFHHRMIHVFHIYGCSSKGSDIVFEFDTTHKAGKPLPHGISVKFAKQSCMMESYPSAFSFFYVFNKSRFRIICPCIEGSLIE